MTYEERRGKIEEKLNVRSGKTHENMGRWFAVNCLITGLDVEFILTQSEERFSNNPPFLVGIKAELEFWT